MGWQAGTLTVTQAGYCVKRRVLAATAIAAGWRGFSARWPLVARYNFWVARYNVRCERARHDHDASRAKEWRDAALRSHNAKHHGAPPLTHHDATVGPGPLARAAHCSARTLLPWHASTTPQALQTKADGRPSKAAAQYTGSLATFFRAQSILLNKQAVSGPVASRRWSF